MRSPTHTAREELAEIDLRATDGLWQRRPPATRRSAGEDERFSDDRLLARVVSALSAPLELRAVLRLLADITLEATNADHCSLFLLEDRHLYPAVASSHATDESLWAAFRAMGPVEANPARWELFTDGEPVYIADARDTALIPPAWVDRFTVRSIGLVSLRSGGEPSGILAVDWKDPHELADRERRALRILGHSAGLAVGNARPFATVRRRARLQEALARGTAALASPLEPDEVIDRLAAAYSDLLGSRTCAVGLIDHERGALTKIASRNTGEVSGPIPMGDIPEHIVAELTIAWAEGKRAVEFPHDPWLAELLDGSDTKVAWYLILPLVVGGQQQGGILLGFDEHTKVDDEELAAAVALAATGALALERHELLAQLSQQLRQLDALYHVNAALTEGADADQLVAGLNQLLADHAIEVQSVSFRDRTLARHFGGDTPRPEERASWRAGNCWRWANASIASTAACSWLATCAEVWGAESEMRKGCSVSERVSK